MQGTAHGFALAGSSIATAIPRDERATSTAPAGQVRVADVLAECAAHAGLTFAGLLVRVGWHSAILAPAQLLRGRTPATIKMKFLPLAALDRVLRRRINAGAAQSLVEKVLFTATTTETVANFKAAMDDPRMETVASQTEKVYRGPGRHQTIRYEKRTPTHFQFAITDCVFVRVLKELKLEAIAPQLCEADRSFWKQAVRGTEIRFSKPEDTMARGGSCCRASFVLGGGPSHQE